MNNLLNKKNNAFVDSFIIFFIFITILFFKALKTLSELFTYGIQKKEILTSKSKLGFDFKIKIK